MMCMQRRLTGGSNGTPKKEGTLKQERFYLRPPPNPQGIVDLLGRLSPSTSRRPLPPLCTSLASKRASVSPVHRKGGNHVVEDRCGSPLGRRSSDAFGGIGWVPMRLL